MKKKIIRISKNTTEKVVEKIVDKLCQRYINMNAVKVFDKDGNIVTKLPIEIKLIGNKQKINEFKNSFEENFF